MAGFSRAMPPADGASAGAAHQIRLLPDAQAGAGRRGVARVRHDGRVSRVVRGQPAGISGLQTCREMSRPQFQPQQAKEIARAFADEGVEYVFIGKSAAILLGYPASSQEVQVFPEKSPANGVRIVAALRRVGFQINSKLEAAITRGKDFVQ